MSDAQPLMPDPTRRMVIEYDPQSEQYILSQNDFERMEAIGIMETLKFALITHTCDDECHEQDS